MSIEIEGQAFRVKAQESLATAVSELANQRYYSCASRCYYATFQTAIAALLQAGVRSQRPDQYWSRAFVQAQFATLVSRHKAYPAAFRDTLPRLLALRHRADYQPAQVSERQASRAVRTAHALVAAIQEHGGDPA